MDHSTAITTQAAERYLLGELSPVERDEFEEHFFTCADCAGAVRTGTIFTVNGRAGAIDERAEREKLKDPSRPGRVTELRPRPGASYRQWLPRAIPAIAAALFLGVAGYQQMRILRLERGADPVLTAHAVTRTVLHSQSRGAAPVVRLAGSSTAVLTLELSAERPAPAYLVDIVRDGKTLGSIPNAPAKDGSIDIEMPSSEAPGGYEILVRERAGGSEAGRFAFQIDK